MRMHRKANLDFRISACKDILTVADLQNKNMKTAALEHDFLDYESLFKNANPVRLEIGCGKGKFVCELCKREPNVNFIAVEKISNVLIEAAERAVSESFTNVHFLNCAAEVLPRYVTPASVQVIYLNFSNPLPKLGYAKQRLTHPRFLNVYKDLLTSDGKIIQKTDDYDFYLFSVQSYLECGYKILEQCEDLAALNDAENIVTEHEKKFMDEGKKIYRIVAEK